MYVGCGMCYGGGPSSLTVSRLLDAAGWSRSQTMSCHKANSTLYFRRRFIQNFQQNKIEDHPERRRRTCGVQITHSPITLTNCSFINIVYVFRYYGSSRHLVYSRRVDPSSLAFSLASHRHSNISLLFTSRFIDS